MQRITDHVRLKIIADQLGFFKQDPASVSVPSDFDGIALNTDGQYTLITVSEDDDNIIFTTPRSGMHFISKAELTAGIN